jgi:hypothetical protein
MRLSAIPLVLVIAVPLAAQQQAARSGLRGTIASIATARPVSAAEVRVTRVDSMNADGRIYADSTHSHLVFTDSAGAFSVRDLDPGKYVLAVRRVGFKPFEGVLTLGSAPLDMELALETGVATLSEMNVTEKTSRATKRLDAVGFSERRKHGNVLRAYDHSDVLAARAVRMEQILDRFGVTSADQILFDGLSVDWNDLLLVPSEIIVGVEIYRSAAMAPVQFTRTLPGRQTFTDVKPAAAPEKVLVAKQPASAQSANINFKTPDERDRGTPMVSHFVLIWTYIP